VRTRGTADHHRRGGTPPGTRSRQRARPLPDPLPITPWVLSAHLPRQPGRPRSHHPTVSPAVRSS
jgi:hypothetical protein